MLGYLFGFNARISRVPFLLCTSVLGAGLVLLAYGVTGTTPGSGRTDVLLIQAASSGPMQITFLPRLPSPSCCSRCGSATLDGIRCA